MTSNITINPFWQVLRVGFHVTSVCLQTCSPSYFQYWRCDLESWSWRGVFDTTLCNAVSQWLPGDRWFSNSFNILIICKNNRYIFQASVMVMVVNPTFYNITAISWRSALLVQETGVPGKDHRSPGSHWETALHDVVSLT
jgi:hypothetical protein